jgi:hypothetical protein|tara:strand:- start:3955 stop:4134 length:180 start_codon:yes stop_codon:yes gene_type:complete
MKYSKKKAICDRLKFKKIAKKQTLGFVTRNDKLMRRREVDALVEMSQFGINDKYFNFDN